jgi:hypothetical protein
LYMSIVIPREEKWREGRAESAGYLVVYSDIEHEIGLHFLDGELFKRRVPEKKRDAGNAE